MLEGEGWWAAEVCLRRSLLQNEEHFPNTLQYQISLSSEHSFLVCALLLYGGLPLGRLRGNCARVRVGHSPAGS